MSETFVCGLNTVTSLVSNKPETVRVIFIDKSRKDKRVQAIIDKCLSAGINVERVDKRRLQNKVGDDVRHQGVVVSIVSDSTSPSDLHELLDALTEPAFLLVLDGVLDPHNLGACLRSAEAAGVQAVIIPKDNSCKLTPAASKAASGAAELLPVFTVSNLARTLKEIKERNIWLVGASGDAGLSIYETDLKSSLALVLGGEGKGLRRLTSELCDSLASIPMGGKVDSLNVSVAAGVCLFEAVRQRQTS